MSDREKYMNNSKLNKNVIYSLIKSFTAILFPLITFPYISRVLLVDKIGMINFSQSVVSYFALFAGLGINTYAIRECSKVRVKRTRLSELSSQLFSINVITTIIVYVVLIIVLCSMKSLKHYLPLICILSLNIIFTTLGTEWINYAMEDLKFISLRTLAFQIISLLLMISFVHNAEDYIIYAIITVVASSGANIINIYHRKRYCDIHLTLKTNIREHYRPIITLFSMIIAQQVYVNSDITILGIFRGDYEVGLYSISVKIYNLVNTLAGSIATVVVPQMVVHYKKYDYDKINELARYALHFIIIIGFPCFIGMNVIPREIISTIAGPSYVDAVWSLRLLSIALIASYIGGFIGNIILIPSGREKICLKASCYSAIINVFLNLIIIPQYGLNGAAFTTAASEMVALFIVYRNLEKEIKVSKKFDLLKPVICEGLCIILCANIIRQASSNDIVICIGTILLSTICYIAILIYFKDDFVIGLIKRIVPGHS